jgi:uncharacterized protein DUF4058
MPCGYEGFRLKAKVDWLFPGIFCNLQESFFPVMRWIMKSPFPGMDPYIEACGLWGNFHLHLMDKIHEEISDAAPERYTVRSGERSYIVLVESEGKKEHPFYPDVRINAPGREPAHGTALAEPETEFGPVEMRGYIQEEFREAFVEILETEPEVRLITSIEVLSPSNKREDSEGWEIYLRKRQGLFVGAANLVEIDLLRGGTRMPMAGPWPSSPYTIMVFRHGVIPRWQAWRGYSHLPLPPFPVPLAHSDPDISLNLQPMIDAIYTRSRYYRSIDYSKPLNPPLGPEELKFLEQQGSRKP